MSGTNATSGFHVLVWALIAACLFLKLLIKACQAPTTTTVVRYVPVQVRRRPNNSHVSDNAAVHPEAGGSEVELAAPPSSTTASEVELGMGGIEARGVACSQ